MSAGPSWSLIQDWRKLDLPSSIGGPLRRTLLFIRQVQANPTEQDVLDGLDRYRALGCDGLIGLGGGSPIDAAKAIRLLSTHDGSLADYDFTQGGLDRITPDMPPMVAMPTTAGTGTEAGRGTLIQLDSTGRKTLALSPHLLPSLAICDPELTLTLGPELTAGTGMDAFTHCVESYLSTTYNPLCDGIALEGLRHISRGLESSVRDGQDRQARREMMMGSLLGGISFHKGLGVVHSLSHALGSEGRVHHGTLERHPAASRPSLQPGRGRGSNCRPRPSHGRRTRRRRPTPLHHPDRIGPPAAAAPPSAWRASGAGAKPHSVLRRARHAGSLPSHESATRAKPTTWNDSSNRPGKQPCSPGLPHPARACHVSRFGYMLDDRSLELRITSRAKGGSTACLDTMDGGSSLSDAAPPAWRPWSAGG